MSILILSTNQNWLFHQLLFATWVQLNVHCGWKNMVQQQHQQRATCLTHHLRGDVKNELLVSKSAGHLSSAKLRYQVTASRFTDYSVLQSLCNSQVTFSQRRDLAAKTVSDYDLKSENREKLGRCDIGKVAIRNRCQAVVWWRRISFAMWHCTKHCELRNVTNCSQHGRKVVIARNSQLLFP